MFVTNLLITNSYQPTQHVKSKICVHHIPKMFSSFSFIAFVFLTPTQYRNILIKIICNYIILEAMIYGLFLRKNAYEAGAEINDGRRAKQKFSFIIVARKNWEKNKYFFPSISNRNWQQWQSI